MAKKQSKERYPFQEFLETKERETKTGLCPNCHKFGEKCTCGYNHGFPTGASFRKYINTQKMKEPVKMKGTIITMPITYTGKSKLPKQIFYNGSIIKDIQYYNEEYFTCKGFGLIPIKEVKTLVVKHEKISFKDYLKTFTEKITVSVDEEIKNDWKREKIQYFNLKYSQWEAVVYGENNEINTGKVIEFYTKIVAYDKDGNKIDYAIERGDYTVTFARIIPEKVRTYTKEEVKELIDLLLYCKPFLKDKPHLQVRIKEIILKFSN